MLHANESYRPVHPVNDSGPLDGEPVLKAVYIVLLVIEAAFGTLCNLLVSSDGRVPNLSKAPDDEKGMTGRGGRIGLVVSHVVHFQIVFVIAYSRKLHTMDNMFILNLALADFTIGMVTSPFSLVGLIHGKSWFDERPVLCAVIAAVCTAGCLATNWNTLLIAVNRYVLVCHHDKYNRIYTPSATFLMCISVWIAMFLVHFPNHLGWGDIRYSDEYFMCTIATHSLSYTIFAFAVGIYLPVICSFVAYYAIYLRVKRLRCFSVDRTTDLSPAAYRLTKKERRRQTRALFQNILIIRKLFKYYICYLVLVSPLGLTTIIGHFWHVPRVAYVVTLTMGHGVSIANTLFYAASLGQFWAAARSILGVRKRAENSQALLLMPRSNTSNKGGSGQSGARSGPLLASP